MALQVWLPLLGNVNNQGLSNVSITNNNASVDNNGKIGKCLSFNGTSSVLHCDDIGLDTSKDYTLACWFYLNAIPTGSNARLVQISVSTDTSFGNMSTGIVVDYLNNGSQGKFALLDGGAVAYYNYNFVVNTWYHVTYTKQGDTKKLYLNGELLTTLTFGSSIRSPKHFYVGGTGAANRMLNGKMNDVRVYDSCLSDREIEILSRGLVAHYPLDNNGSGQPNLYDFESVANKWAVEGLTLANATDEVYGNVLKITSPSSVSSQRIYRTVSNVWKADTKFTVSFLAKASKTAVVKMSRSLANYAPDVTVGTAWKRYSTVITCSTTVEGGTLSIQTSTASADIYITQIKLELGDKATVYCPGVGDSHYIPLGYNSTTEYDVSGYQNNASPWAYDSTGSIDITTDTPRYSTSTFINSANPTSGEAAGTRYIYGNCTLVKPEKLTLTFWCKPIKGYGNTTSHGIFSLTNYDIGQNAAVDYQEAPLNHRDGGFDVNGISGSTYTHKRLTVTFTANEWHHYVITYDGRYAKLYKDGVQSTSADMGATMPLGSMKGIVIGFSKAGGVWRHVQSYYSDVRLYATALSATQVAELYNTAVSVANNGTLMGYELVEV